MAAKSIKATALTKAHDHQLDTGPRPPPMALEYAGHFFRDALPCEHCGAASNKGKTTEPADPYDRTLLNEARRVIHHAGCGLAGAGADSLAVLNSAGMLRDAARLLDLLMERHRAREADAPKAKRVRS